MSPNLAALPLHTEVHGPADAATTVVIAHGLFGSSTNWRSVAKAWSTRYRVVTLDCRNHGRSPWSAEHNYPVMAVDLAALLRDIDASRVVLIGHSMGGKAAMDLALTKPELVAGLVVADIAPVRYRHDHLQFIQAMQRLPVAEIATRKQADKLLAESIADPLVRQFLLQNLVKSDIGHRWRINLNALQDNMNGLVDFPMTENGHPFSGPTLFVRGAMSDYVDPIRHEEIIRVLFPNYRMKTIEGAGHWLHAEKPTEFLSIVTEFVEQSFGN